MMVAVNAWAIIVITIMIENIEGNIFRIIRNESIPCETLQKKSYTKISMSEKELLQIFQAQGGTYVREYMAPDQQTAKVQFRNLLAVPRKFQEPSKKSNFAAYRENFYTKTRLIQDMKKYIALYKNRTGESHKQTKTYSNARYRRLRTRSRDYTSSINRNLELQKILGYLAHGGLPYAQPAVVGIRPKRDTSSGESTEIEYCRIRGTDVDGYLNMCTTCAASTTLTDDKFPRVLNEVVCSQADRGCFTINDTSHGACRQKYIYMNLLQRKEGYCKIALKGDAVVIVDDWQLYTQPIRVSCECYIDKRSVFADFI